MIKRNDKYKVHLSFSNLLLCFLILLFTVQTNAQNQYQLQWKKEVPLFSAGLLFGGTGTLLKSKKAPLTEAQIAQLDRNNVWKFERFVTHNWNTRAIKASDVFLYGSHVLPLTIYAHPQARTEWKEVAVMGAEMYLINAGLTTLVKELFQRKRPFLYNENAPIHKKMERDATSSFFSGHTSVTAANSFFTAYMLTSYTKNDRYDPLIWISGASIPAITAALRVRAGKHFPTDVAVGYIVGALSGILVPMLHKR